MAQIGIWQATDGHWYLKSGGEMLPYGPYAQPDRAADRAEDLVQNTSEYDSYQFMDSPNRDPLLSGNLEDVL